MDMDENTLIHILQRIEKRLANVEEKLDAWAHKTVPRSIHIDVNDVETLHLEKLSYHIDELHVKEISGMMNMGITSLHHGKAKLQKYKAKETEHKHATAAGPRALDISVKVNGKSVPFRVFTTEQQTDTEEQDMKTPEQSVDATFRINDIHIGTVEDASVVNFGNNFPTNFRSMKKHNQGFGNIVGNENDVHDILSFMEEKDVVEVFNEHQDPKQAEWLETILKQQVKDKDEDQNHQEDDEVQK